MIVFNLAFARDRDRPRNECSHQFPVDFFAPLCRCRTGCVEEQRPVNRALTRYRAESQEIRKEPHWISVRVQFVPVANLGMAVTIGCVGELERYKPAMRRAKPLRPVPKHLSCHGLSDE